MARHRARLLVANGTPVGECSVCGGRTVGFGPTLRHEGEITPALVPAPEDARTLAQAREQAEAVARDLGADPSIVDALVDVLYAGGFLRRRRGERRAHILLDEPEPRDLDHAERAAGERVPA